MPVAVAGFVAVAVLTACGSTPAAAPVTSTVTAVHTSTVVSRSTATVVSTEAPVTETATETATETVAAAGPSIAETCKRLSDLTDTLSQPYLENYKQDQLTFTDGDYRGLGKALRMHAGAMDILSDELTDETVKAAWKADVKLGQNAAAQYLAGSYSNGSNDLVKYIDGEATALNACNAAR